MFYLMAAQSVIYHLENKQLIIIIIIIIINGTPLDKNDIRGMLMRKQTEKTTFSRKDDWCKTLHL